VSFVVKVTRGGRFGESHLAVRSRNGRRFLRNSHCPRLPEPPSTLMPSNLRACLFPLLNLLSFAQLVDEGR
jgi:hypothetical protein